MAKKLLPEDHQLRRVQYRRQQDDALDVFEPQLLSAVRQHAHQNDTVPETAPLREVVEHNPSNGQKIVKFIGLRSFIHDLKAPVRRVLSFTTDKGRFDAAKGRWF
jgi:hypothetical protein